MCVSLACFLKHQASGQIDGQTGSSRGNSLLCRSVAWKMSDLLVIFLKSLPTLEKGGGSQVLGPWEQEKSLSIECGGSSYLGTFNRNCNLGNDWERSAASALRCIRVEGHG